MGSNGPALLPSDYFGPENKSSAQHVPDGLLETARFSPPFHQYRPQDGRDQRIGQQSSAKKMETSKRKANNEMSSKTTGIVMLPSSRKRRTRSSLNQQQVKGSAALISLPYFAPESDLPADLPTTAEIEDSREILHERTAAKVVSVGPYVVKYGQHVNLEEGRTMKFVEECAGIPVPRVYALYSELGKSYIIMERIDGETLQNQWKTFSEHQKDDVAAQMKKHLQNLRAISSPNVYCSLGNKPLRDPLFWTGRGGESLRCDGPFNSESEFTNAIIKKCKASEALKGKASFYEDNLPLVFHNHPPVLTHGDLQPKNIMVRAKSNTIVFLDWESAGWYPEFWEFAQTTCGCGLFEGDWHRWISKFLEPFLGEYAWLKILQHEIEY